MASQARTRTAEEIDRLFWDKVKFADGPMPTACWIWTGAKRSDGYGVRTINRKVVACHRWAYQRFVGPIQSREFCCHHCDNRACVNPDHIFIGDWKSNAQDALSKSRLRSGESWAEACRQHAPHGENHICAKLTEDQARHIRSSIGLKTQMQVVREMGLSRTLVRGVWEGKTWKHVKVIENAR